MPDAPGRGGGCDGGGEISIDDAGTGVGAATTAARGGEICLATARGLFWVSAAAIADTMMEGRPLRG